MAADLLRQETQSIIADSIHLSRSESAIEAEGYPSFEAHRLSILNNNGPSDPNEKKINVEIGCRNTKKVCLTQKNKVPKCRDNKQFQGKAGEGQAAENIQKNLERQQSEEKRFYLHSYQPRKSPEAPGISIDPQVFNPAPFWNG